MRSQSAFTLIEILLILVLLSMLVGLAIPRLGALFFDYEFTSAVQNIDKLIHYAAYRALLDRTIYKLTLDEIDRQVVLSRRAAEPDAEFQELHGDLINPIVLPESIAFSNITTDEIYFFPDGSATVARFVLTRGSENKATFVSKGYVYGYTVTYE